MFPISPISKPVAKQAKIVKLNKITQNPRPQKTLYTSLTDSDFSDISFISFGQVESSSEAHSTVINNSLDSSNSFKSLSDCENDVSGEFLKKVFVIEDHTTQLVYGGISVKRGEFVYLINESQYFCLIENKHGQQGIVPKEICIDLESTVRNAKFNLKSFNGKITSL